MRTLGTIALALSLLVAVPVAAAGPEPTTDEQKTVYTIGLAVAQQLEIFSLSAGELDMVLEGIRDGVAGKPKFDSTPYRAKLQQMAETRGKAKAEQEQKETAPFLEKLAKEKGAEKTASGLIYIPVKEGTGAQPKATDTVKVHYKGTLRDGTVFDSSIERGQPFIAALNRVIPCWTEGVQKMKVGGTAKLGCPSTIAYGDRGAPPKIKPGAALLFEVELLGIEAAPPGAPAAAPAGAPAGHP